MKVLIDTNVLISAALFPNSVPSAAYRKAAVSPNSGLICEQSVEELMRVFHRKFPHRLASMEKFLSMALLTLEVIPVPEEKVPEEVLVRDKNDRPILRAAIAAGADALLTGDKDFLESGLENPLVMTPAELLKWIADESDEP